MGAKLAKGDNGILVLHVSGALHKEELDAIQTAAVNAAEPVDNARLLIVVADDFCGWVGDEEWGDVTFFMAHGDRIAKIAIVGDPKWEVSMLAFTAAGMRRAPVRYFTPDQRDEAEEWVC